MKTITLAASLVAMLCGLAAPHAQAQNLCDNGACNLAPTDQPAPMYDLEAESNRAQARLDAQGAEQRQDLQTRMDLNALGFGVHRP
jgi:hypothetical protein